MSNNIKLPPNFSDNLDIKRNEMPQIKGEHIHSFLDFIEKKGIKTHSEEVPIKTLKYVQNEYNSEKVNKLIDLDKTDHHFKNRIIISSDNYIVDGNHRALAYFNIDQNCTKKVLMIDLPIDDLLEMAKLFPKASFKALNEYKKMIDIIRTAIQESAIN